VVTTLDLSSKLSDIPAVRGRAPLPCHGYVKGWGVFGLPFDSGHVLALTVTFDIEPLAAFWDTDEKHCGTASLPSSAGLHTHLR
jgi:hypothetical protein